MSAMKHRRFKWLNPANGEKGYMLVAALTLMTGLTLLGTTAYILSSTDIKVGANFKHSQQVLQVAMAGGERARELLRQENLATGDSSTFNDELSKSQRKGQNSTLDGYTATTDDQALATGTIDGITYSAYLTNDSLDADDEALFVPLVAKMSLPVSEVGQHKQLVVFCGPRDYIGRVRLRTGGATTLRRHGT